MDLRAQTIYLRVRFASRLQRLLWFGWSSAYSMCQRSVHPPVSRFLLTIERRFLLSRCLAFGACPKSVCYSEPWPLKLKKKSKLHGHFSDQQEWTINLKSYRFVVHFCSRFIIQIFPPNFILLLKKAAQFKTSFARSLFCSMLLTAKVNARPAWGCCSPPLDPTTGILTVGRVGPLAAADTRWKNFNKAILCISIFVRTKRV